jgi:hypothetical protein
MCPKTFKKSKKLKSSFMTRERQKAYSFVGFLLLFLPVLLKR